MTSTSMRAAFQNIGVAVPEEKPQVRRSRVPEGAFLAWHRIGFGKLYLMLADCRIDNVKADNTLAWASVTPRHQFDAFNLRFFVQPEEDVRVVRLSGSPQNPFLRDVTQEEIQPFSINVQWDRKLVPGGAVPKIGNLHDVNFAFLRPDGHFHHIEMAVITRRALMRDDECQGIWLTSQTIFHGQVVEDAGKHYVIPATTENAYPGSRYAGVTAVGADKLVDYAVGHGAYVALSAAQAAEWAFEVPRLPDHLRTVGWEPAVALWFNVSMGGGQLLLNDGEKCFVHMKAMQGRSGQPLLRQDGAFPRLSPGFGVAVKYEDGRDGLAATAVRPI